MYNECETVMLIEIEYTGYTVISGQGSIVLFRQLILPDSAGFWHLIYNRYRLGELCTEIYNYQNCKISVEYGDTVRVRVKDHVATMEVIG